MAVKRMFWIISLVSALALVILLPTHANAASSTVWMCAPEQISSPCDGPLSGQTLTRDGSSHPLILAPSKSPRVDCFYVYPTQSRQQTANANFSKDPSLKGVTINQARQFSQSCRVFAPVYRQYTLWALANPTEITDRVRDIAYKDVKDAWKDYLKNYNRGRGVILIGHSQGASHLARLIEKEIDPVPSIRKKVVSAYLMGANVYVPKNRLVGGQFQNIPACKSKSQTKCVIAYSSFLNKPAEESMFGRVGSGYWVHPDPRPNPAKYEVLCVNPAKLVGAGRLLPLANLTAFISPGSPEGSMPWTEVPDYYTSKCVNKDGASWLQVNKVPGQDFRPDFAQMIGSPNGTHPYGNLHTGDINLALGNLVRVAASQSNSYLKKLRLKANIKKGRANIRKSLKQLKRAKIQCKKGKRFKGKRFRKAKLRYRRQCKVARKTRVKVSSQRKANKKRIRKLRLMD